MFVCIFTKSIFIIAKIKEPVFKKLFECGMGLFGGSGVEIFLGFEMV